MSPKREWTIYLAGPINGCTDDEAHHWRNKVIAELGDIYEFLNPMDRDYRGKEKQNTWQIILADETAINNSQIVLVNADRPTWGTAMEVRDAFRWKDKYVVAFADVENPSPWLVRNTHTLVRTIDEAISYLRSRRDTI